jgi:predicted DNA-binding ribbon-helix-helix protein
MYKVLLLLFFGLMVSSCNSDVDQGEFVVGSDYLSLNNKIILIDTLTVDVATINFDSLVTSGQNRILVGNYDDPILGKVKSESYFQLSASDYALNNESGDTNAPNYVFDSIQLVLKEDKYFYGDTTKVQSLSIHRLTQKVKPNLDDDSFYNNSSLSYDTESLGSISFKPKPNSTDSVVVKLNNEFGNALFLKLKKLEVSNFDEFTAYLKGFVIKSTTGNSSSIIGFNLSSALRLYYSKYQGDSETSFVKNFSVLDAAKQFNNITLDRTGTQIQDLPISSSKLSSLQTANRAFIQSGTGIACRVDFPNIKQLKYIAEKGAIVDAELIIRPVNNTYSAAYPLVDSLRVFVGDKLNRIKGTLNTAAGSPIYAILNKTSDEFNANIGYKISIGAFLQNEMVKESDAKSSLILTLPSISKGVDRLVLGDQKNAENKIQLKIYYISY